MRSEYIWSVVLFFPLLIIQTTVVPFISINGITPDLILIMLVFYTVRNGQVYGTILGFVYGFLFDLITGSLLGSAMLSKTIAGFIAGYFSNENKREIYFKTYIFVLIVFLCSVVDLIINSFFSSIDLNTSIVLLLFEQGVLPGIYTALLSALIILFYPKRSIIEN
ncbi:MAG: rod shape-determining protein MreD [Ignavibacteriaceae bacterium]|jgi:rod shape-determining protein MreD